MNEPEAVPAPVASALVLPLPIVELMVAGSLVSTASVAWGTLGALLLLLAFIVAIVLNLARGRAPECRCFGQFSTSPIGWTTLVRNVSLVALTGSIAWRGPGPSPSEWFGDLTAAQRIGFVTGSVLVTLLAAEGWLLFLVLHQNGRILLRLDELEVQLRVGGRARQRAHRVAGLPIGALAPDFSLMDPGGERMTLKMLCAAGKPLILLFSDPGCPSCTALWKEIDSRQRHHAAWLTRVLVSGGSAEANQARLAEHGKVFVLLDRGHKIAESYQVTGVPSAAAHIELGPTETGCHPGRQASRRAPARPTELSGGR